MKHRKEDVWFLEYAALFTKVYNLCCRWASLKHTTYTNVLLMMELYFCEQGCEAAELADKLYLPRQTMTYTLKSLEQDGMIVRTLHLTDGRRKVIQLTEKGEDFAKSVMEELGIEFLGFTDHLPNDKQVLLSTVKEYIAELEEKLANLQKEKANS